MKLVKQRRKDDCLSCVAAMAFNVTPELYEAYAEERSISPENDQTFVKFAMDVGYLVGIYLAETLKLEHTDELCNVNILPGRFFVAVRSACQSLKERGIDHAVYFDQGVFYDPACSEPHKDVSRYEIVSFIPLCKNADHKRWELIPNE